MAEKKLIYRNNNDEIVVDDSLDGNKVVLYEDDDIEVRTTGHFYDFIATIENKGTKPLSILCYCDEICIHVYTIDGNDWTGVLDDEEGWDTLVAICAGEFSIEEEGDSND